MTTESNPRSPLWVELAVANANSEWPLLMPVESSDGTTAPWISATSIVAFVVPPKTAVTVKLLVPAFCTSKEISDGELVSFKTNAGAVPALVKVNEVGVANPLAKVKAIFEPLVVVMVLPALYADCKLKLDEEHSTTSVDPFKHNIFPVAVVNPVKLKSELPLVLMVTF